MPKSHGTLHVLCLWHCFESMSGLVCCQQVRGTQPRMDSKLTTHMDRKHSIICHSVSCLLYSKIVPAETLTSSCGTSPSLSVLYPYYLNLLFKNPSHFFLQNISLPVMFPSHFMDLNFLSLFHFGARPYVAQVSLEYVIQPRIIWNFLIPILPPSNLQNLRQMPSFLVYVLQIKLKAPCMLSKHSASRSASPAPFLIFKVST